MFNFIVRHGPVLLCIRGLLTLLSPTITCLVTLPVLLLKTFIPRKLLIVYNIYNLY